MADRPDLVLASASPRRALLLTAALGPSGLQPIVRPVALDESPRGGESPAVLASRLAVAKAVAAGVGAGELVIGADTVVELDGRSLGTPETLAEATRMLDELGGRTHRVLTAVAVARGGSVALGLDVARVTLRRLATSQHEAYLSSEIWRGKAGGYGVQDPGIGLVERVEGSLSCVIGLPLGLLAGLLAASGWNPAG